MCKFRLFYAALKFLQNSIYQGDFEEWFIRLVIDGENLETSFVD